MLGIVILQYSAIIIVFLHVIRINVLYVVDASKKFINEIHQTGYIM